MCADLLLKTWDIVQPWFPFHFSDRQHPWIRHIHVHASLDLKRKRIIILYDGATLRFNSLGLIPSQEQYDQEVYSSFKNFEDVIARSFFNDHFMYGVMGEKDQPVKLYCDIDVKKLHETRNILYLDYKFHKAQQEEKSASSLKHKSTPRKQIKK